jgi:hypothetical protein
MKRVVKHFQDYVRASGYLPFDNVSQKGHWKQLTVRTSLKGDLMVWAILSPQGLGEEERNKIRREFKEHMMSLDADCAVTSLHLQFVDRKQRGRIDHDLSHCLFFINGLNCRLGEPDPPIELLFGSPVISERLLDLEFLISPQVMRPPTRNFTTILTFQ